MRHINPLKSAERKTTVVIDRRINAAKGYEIFKRLSLSPLDAVRSRGNAPKREKTLARAFLDAAHSAD